MRLILLVYICAIGFQMWSISEDWGVGTYSRERSFDNSVTRVGAYSRGALTQIRFIQSRNTQPRLSPCPSVSHLSRCRLVLLWNKTSHEIWWLFWPIYNKLRVIPTNSKAYAMFTVATPIRTWFLGLQLLLFEWNPSLVSLLRDSLFLTDRHQTLFYKSSFSRGLICLQK